MRGRVVTHGALAVEHVDARINGIAHTQGTLTYGAVMTKDLCLNLLRVFDQEFAMNRGQHAVVANLATRFGIERCLVEYNHTGITGCEAINGDAIFIQSDDVRFCCQQVITFEAGGRAFVR